MNRLTHKITDRSACSNTGLLSSQTADCTHVHTTPTSSGLRDVKSTKILIRFLSALRQTIFLPPVAPGGEHVVHQHESRLAAGRRNCSMSSLATADRKS